MRPEDLLTRAPSPEVVARETRKLPQPTEEAREALRRSLEAAARPPTPAPWPALLQEARGKMDSRYAEPATSHRGGLAGLALVVSKRVFRRVFQPFINEALRKQVEFNESILDALANIHDVQREHARTQATWRQELEHRLARIEAAAERAATRGRDEAPTPVAESAPSKAMAGSAGHEPSAAAPVTSASVATSHEPAASGGAKPRPPAAARSGDSPRSPADRPRGGASRGRAKRG